MAPLAIDRMRQTLAAGLGALALLFLSVLPSGVMVARADGHSIITLCTGHGPPITDHGRGHPGEAPKQGHDTVCAFAGHGLGVATPLAASIREVAFTFSEHQAPRPFDLVCGQGLAAPPPPSQGPPTLSI